MSLNKALCKKVDGFDKIINFFQLSCSFFLYRNIGSHPITRFNWLKAVDSETVCPAFYYHVSWGHLSSLMTPIMSLNSLFFTNAIVLVCLISTLTPSSFVVHTVLVVSHELSCSSTIHQIGLTKH